MNDLVTRSQPNWTISEDLANILLKYIYDYKPKIILELGSGLSTCFIAEIINQKQKFISLEHDLRFYSITNFNVKRNNLQKKVNIILAPLKTFVINGEKWQWYNINKIKTLNRIDMLFIDGPPGYCQKYARYPAIPLLYKKLHKNSVIILDDAKREDEIHILRKWEEEFSDLQFRIVDSQKGAAILSCK